MDLDEFLAPSWRPKLEAAWHAKTTAAWCQKVRRASVDDATPLTSFSVKNFHHRWGYRFKRAVHEALSFTVGNESTCDCYDIVIYHVQEPGKATRQQYLPLMELAHRENPDDAQICFWLARDYIWAKRNDEACTLLQRYLNLPASTWDEERSEAMRYLARIQPDKKMFWLDKARTEAPHRREIWLDLAEELHGKADWPNLFWACINGTENTRRINNYLDDNHCWGFRLFDLGAIAAWHLNVMDRAVEWGQKALELAQADQKQRLKNNLDFFVGLRNSHAPRHST
jgi:tetratricopeptide (TPR) repeat protein